MAVQVPVTCKDPVTGAVAQPAPIAIMFRFPLTFRHDAVTFQVPTTLPPQPVTFEQAELPPVPAVPPLPVELLKLGEHALEMVPAASAMARAAARIFIETFLSRQRR